MTGGWRAWQKPGPKCSWHVGASLNGVHSAYYFQKAVSRSLLDCASLDSPQFIFLGSRPVPLFPLLILNRAVIHSFSPTNMCGVPTLLGLL